MEEAVSMIYDSVAEIIADHFEIEKDELDTTTSLVDDLGADSLDSFDIMMALEDEFDIDIPTEDAEDLRTISDIVNYLEDRV